MIDRRQREPWHVKKEIQIGHIITTVTIAASVVVYINRIEQRIAITEAALAHQRERDMRQDADLVDRAAAIARQLERIDGKLDRLVEKSSGPRGNGRD